MTGEQWKKEIENSDKFIQDLFLDFPWVEWGEGSMEISSVPKGWEKIVRNLFECLNTYAKSDRFVPKTDWTSKIWNGFCVFARNLFMRVEKRVPKKIRQGLSGFRWKYLQLSVERKYPPFLYIEQIKQKFDLRIYTSGGDDVMQGMINMATYMASKTCEVTGNAGVLCVNKRGWYRTLSKAKAKELGFQPVKN